MVHANKKKVKGILLTTTLAEVCKTGKWKLGFIPNGNLSDNIEIFCLQIMTRIQPTVLCVLMFDF